ncbi:helix-turn-helix domain-containing protein [Sinomonas atrocyanea]|jgi:transposase|uniref:helix-turn-helix domain-containing protein n=1 Tax=Sinomonas atrocyanea TaxID=37927 RepID=UPI002782FA14|nr:helix-turn-helix domain-containing protein [Sinomonas atrocyanea]MDQ0261375.1 transposase [Sinomonas atrocyanea]MDR6622926.1 transposase [Sinomonas atrocyanea]
MSTELIESLLAEEERYAEESERARSAMLFAAERRHEAIFGLHAEGLSIRDIAKKLGCSPSVVQDSIEKAKRRRPAMGRREQRVSWEIHRAIADRIRQDPRPVLEVALKNLDRMKAKRRDEYARGWVEEWESLVRGDVSALIERMLGTDERAIDLRQMTPFAGAVSQADRLVAIHKAVALAA